MAPYCVRLRQRGVKFKGHRLPWIDANSGGSCCLDQCGIARNAERDVPEECGHKLMCHEIPVAKSNGRRHPCHESNTSLCRPFCDVKGFLADINGHVNFSWDHGCGRCSLCPGITQLRDRNEVCSLVRRYVHFLKTCLCYLHHHHRFVWLRPFLPQLTPWYSITSWSPSRTIRPYSVPNVVSVSVPARWPT